MTPLKPFYTNRPYTKVTATNESSRDSYIIDFCVNPVKHINFSAGPENKLWLNTCFEVFEFDLESSRYIEWNFSTSGLYNAYLFKDYRKLSYKLGSEAVTGISKGANDFSLITRFPKLLKQSKLQFSAIIKYKNNSFNYFAQAHLGSKPDFHQLIGTLSPNIDWY